MEDEKEIGQHSRTGTQEEVEPVEQTTNDVVQIDNVVNTVIVQTIRNNQLITTQAQTLSSLTRPAASRQLLQISATENTRTPRYPGMTNTKIWLLST
ncbi:hypothetical protein TSUD_239340 [Trifolium subterraneum]|uniref:Uncharacterized protein n=1 Tax=Trifolium subterraneum TaxID=3900 RepID=A0A2Z6NG99_TRISU|nr:hypothetical protein TSUD_239340 [Trifolium subterraneum]